jgi:hypothetical protein
LILNSYKRLSDKFSIGRIQRRLPVIEWRLKVPKYGKRESIHSIKRTFGEYVTARKCHNIVKEILLKIALYNMFNRMTENTFRSERIFQIAEHRGISVPDEILRRIYVCKIYNTSHLEMIIQDLGKSIEEYRTKLVIVDSIIALHRAEFTGRRTLAERQQRLNIMLHKLNRLAEVHNIAVVITNQVQSQPDDFSAGRDSLRATGGNVMGHATTYRILLRKAGSTRIAIMIDSPYHA